MNPGSGPANWLLTPLAEKLLALLLDSFDHYPHLDASGLMAP